MNRVFERAALLSLTIACFAAGTLHAADLKQNELSQSTSAKTGSVIAPAHRVLLGRIEELSEGAVSPPLPGPQDPNKGSFPAAFIGTWIGHIVVDQSDYLALKKSNPEMWIRESNILFVGREGLGRAVFARTGNSIQAEAPLVQFKPTENDMKYMDLVNKDKFGPSMHFDVIFGAKTNATTLTGAINSETETINRITALGEDHYQQQIVTAGRSDDWRKGLQRVGTAEIVSDFHKLSPQEMEVNLAMVKYAKDGAVDSKVIMHGTFMKR